MSNVIHFHEEGKTMDAITDRKQAASICPYEQMRAKILRDLLSPNEQVQLRALESLRDYFGEKCVSYSSLQQCTQHLEKRQAGNRRKKQQIVASCPTNAP